MTFVNGIRFLRRRLRGLARAITRPAEKAAGGAVGGLGATEYRWRRGPHKPWTLLRAAIACSVACFAFGWAPAPPTATPARAPVAYQSIRSLGVVRPISFSELVNDVPIATRARIKPAPRRSRRYVLPVARKWLTPGRALRAHHDYPAWDVPLPPGTMIRSVHAGSVAATTSIGACGTGLVVQGDDGFTYTYCHGTTLLVEEGDRLHARERIMRSGSTGRSTGAHLHLQIAGRDGSLLCPQPLIEAWLAHRDIGPSQAEGDGGCFYATEDPESPIDVPVRSRTKGRGERHPKAGHSQTKADPNGDGNEADPGPSGNQGDGDSTNPSEPPPDPRPSPSPSPSPPPTPSPSPTPSTMASP